MGTGGNMKNEPLTITDQGRRLQ